MKRKKIQDGQQKRQPRRLDLHRETLRRLDDPALLALARGNFPPIDTVCPTHSSVTTTDD